MTFLPILIKSTGYSASFWLTDVINAVYYVYSNKTGREAHTIMKKTVLTLTALAVLSSNVFAEAEQATCKDVQDMANSIMGARQAGAPMSKLYEIADGNKLLEHMVIAAYEQPQYATDEYQQKAVKRFADKYFLSCIKAKRS